MGGKGGALTLILVLFCSLWIVLPSVDVVKANFMPTPELPLPIYIRSDGSVDPQSGIQKNGDTYMLTRDIDNYITVQRNHIIIDGNGFRITQTPINTSGSMIPLGFYPGIRLNNRINVTVKNVRIYNCISGITFNSATNITITNNTFTSISEIAIFGSTSSNCTIFQNDITDNYGGIGIQVINTTRVLISENNIKRNSAGVYISGSGYPSNYITITRNDISDNTGTGVRISQGSENSMVGNNIVNNTLGLYVSDTKAIIHHNSFDNAENVDSNSCVGPWDDGSEGNYWSDYNGTDQDGDGIGDTAYIVETPRTWIEPSTHTPVTYGVNAQDNYPLMNPVDINAIPEFPSWIILPLFVVLTLVVLIVRNRLKRKALALTFIAALLFSAVAGRKLVFLGKANPWIGTDWVSPADYTKPPTLTIMSPQKNIVYNSNNVTLSFNAHVGGSESYVRLMQVFYKTDWEQNETYVYKNEGISIPYDENAITDFSYSVNLTGIPEGKHYITVHAVEWGAYIDGYFVHMFSINGSSSVNFAIDVSPSVLVLSLVNKTYNISDVPLIFTVNQPVSQMAYSLDGKENIPISGNMTLIGLANGDHNVTVYAKDEAGNIGVSETIYFTVEVPEPFPTALAMGASFALVAVFGVGLSVYFKKRKHRAEIYKPLK